MTPSLIRGMFISPEAQLQQFRQWNRQYRLGFTEAEIDAVGKPPAWPEEPLSAVILHWSLDSPHRTAEYSWKLAAEQQPDTHLSVPVPLDGFHLRLLPEILFEPYSLQWEVVHLGTGIYTAPLKVRGPQSLHAQGFQAAAYFPHWIRAIDGDTVPYLWLAGYEMSRPFDGPGAWDDEWRHDSGHAWIHGFQLPAECYPHWEWEFTLRMGWRRDIKALAMCPSWPDSPLVGHAVPCTEQPRVAALKFA